ncbi:haloacid dehalogenase type II [Kribbella sp. VKM Ac-2566]|uniref:haloacid dehalogenase type II n=1 Tax=Kribbella sp. VKM Ac-2566 TaxID=2512218 RepID=UPI0010625D37|nr:haloacid dehalogenase type II [Kribbella sp. VKM Ac-2566]TDX08328.1 2-haloacid dehalogenase [Kribbella sp. VKM Ac-2566]
MSASATTADLAEVSVIALDIFGTAVDWRTSVSEQVAQIAGRTNTELSPGRFTDEWRDRYLPALEAVNSGTQPWRTLDALHREALDDLLDAYDVGDDFDETARRDLVLAWHRLTPWPDVADGLARLRRRYTVVALSNGGVALLTHLLKDAGLPFDCLLSAEIWQAYKPQGQAYRAAAELLAIRPEQMLMVAAHTWDIDGARRARLRTAFLERPQEKGPNRTADRAADTTCDLAASSLTELAHVLGC